MGFAINPPNSPLIDNQGRMRSEWYRFFSQIQKLVGDDAIAGLKSAPYITAGASSAINNGRVLTSGDGIDVVFEPGLATVSLETTGVAPDTYGAPDRLASIAIDQFGRIVFAEDLELNSDNVTEGIVNLFFTDVRARAALVNGTGMAYDSLTGEIAVGPTLAAYAGGDTPSAFTLSIMDSADPAAWRAAIGAGTSSTTGTVTSVDVSAGTTGLTFGGGPITTSGTITLSGTLGVANGGTGSTTASGARSNLGVVIGTNVQAWDADLDALAALSGTNTIYYRSAANTWSAVSIGSDLAFSSGALNVGSGTGTSSVVRATKPQFTNTIGVGTAAAASGSGVSFPATQSASTDPNTLDDYEEGTWTPTVTSTAGSITSYTVTAFYTKIGRKVDITVVIIVTNNGTGAGAINFTLPFAAATGPRWIGAGREDAMTGNMLQVRIGSGATLGEVLTYNNAYPAGTNYQLVCTASYHV